MGAAPAIAMGAGTLVNVYGQYQAGQSNKRIAEYNAKLLDAEATDAITRGDEAVKVAESDYRQLRGAQRAAIAGQGVTLDSETAVALQNDSQATAARNIRTLKANAIREAMGLRSQARSTRIAGRYAYKGAMLNSAGSFLTGAAQTAAMASDYSNRG